jgi:hypothetical protein
MCLVRMTHSLSRNTVTEHEQALEPADTVPWTPALTALDSNLSQRPSRGVRMRVVVSDQWARYSVIPWCKTLTSPVEHVAHARQHLAMLYGDVMTDWEIQLSDARPLSPYVATTIPASLLAAVRVACDKHNVRLMSLQPRLIAAYNSWRHQLPNRRAWFVTVEQGSLSAARITPQGWDRVHSVRIDSHWPRELKRLQTFGRITSSSPEEAQVFVDAPNDWRAAAEAPGQNLHWLDQHAGRVSILHHLSRIRRQAA